MTDHAHRRSTDTSHYTQGAQPDDNSAYATIDPSEPVVAFKLARIVLTADDTFRFAGATRNTGYDADGTASCLSNMHHAPYPSCQCGFWAVYKMTDVRSTTRGALGLHRYDTLARLVVEISGAAELHTEGLRGHRQRVLSAALPTQCARCKARSSTTIITRGSPQEALAVCTKHIKQDEHTMSPVELANALGTEVTISRELIDETDDPRRKAKPPIGPIRSQIASPLGVMIMVMSMAALVGLFTCIYVLVTAFSGTFWEDLSPMVNQAAAHPGQIGSYDEKAVKLYPVRFQGQLVGATAFDLANNHCSIVLKSSAPLTVFSHLTPMATNYSTSFVENITTNPASNFVNENTTVTSPKLQVIQNQRSPYIVAHVPQATPSACASVGKALSSTGP
jgi:hypothetical protein